MGKARCARNIFPGRNTTNSSTNKTKSTAPSEKRLDVWEVAVIQNGKPKTVTVDTAMHEAALMLLAFSKTPRVIKKETAPMEPVKREETDSDKEGTPVDLSSRASVASNAAMCDGEASSFFPTPSTTPDIETIEISDEEPGQVCNDTESSSTNPTDETRRSPPKLSLVYAKIQKRRNDSTSSSTSSDSRPKKLKLDSTLKADQVANELKQRKKSLKVSQIALVYHKNMARHYPGAETRTPEQQEMRRKNTEASRISRAKTKAAEKLLFDERDALSKTLVAQRRLLSAYSVYANSLREQVDGWSKMWDMEFYHQCRRDAEEQDAEEQFYWCGPQHPAEHPVYKGKNVFGFTHKEIDTMIEEYVGAAREQHIPKLEEQDDGSED